MKVMWKPGPPPGRGLWWAHFRWLNNEVTIESIDVSPAILRAHDPSARLLLKFSDGRAFAFESNLDSFLHHAPRIIEVPDPPELVEQKGGE